MGNQRRGERGTQVTTVDDQQTDWGRQPPQNLDAEMAVLGSMMMSEGCGRGRRGDSAAG